MFNDGGDLSKHFASFLEIVGKLATFDEEILEKEKASKLNRGLTNFFAAFYMMSNLTDSGFYHIINAVEAEVAHRKNTNNPQQQSPTSSSSQPKAKMANKTGRKRHN